MITAIGDLTAGPGNRRRSSRTRWSSLGVLAGPRHRAYDEDMSEPAPEVSVEVEPLILAVDNARRNIVTHLTIHGERVAVIMPAAVIDALRVFADVITREQAALRLPTAISAAIPWTRVLPAAELPLFAAELAEAAAAGPDAPELIATLIREWRATAEAYADPEILAALTAVPEDCGRVPEPVA